MSKLLDEKQAAALLNVSVKTLQAWRYRGNGPRFVKFGRSVRYALADLEAFVLERLRTSTSDSGRSSGYQPPAWVTVVTSHKKSWPSPPSGPAAATPRLKPAQLARLPMRRLHGTVRCRIRTRLVLSDQCIAESKPRRGC